MKKILLFFCAATFVLNSCSSDDLPDSVTSDGVLLKKTIATNAKGKKVTTIYTYDGNKLVSMIDDSGDVGIYYTYTADLITKITYKLPDGTIEQVDTFEYDSNKRVISYVRSEPTDEIGTKELYTYNADGSVSVKDYTGDDKSQTFFNGNAKIFFTNGEVSKITSDYSSNVVYTYDDKNNPDKNVLGEDKLNFIDTSASGILHNIVSEKDSDDGELFTYVFTYNSANYPEKSVETEFGVVTTTEYFY